MNSGQRLWRAVSDAPKRVDRMVTAVFGAFYCMGSVYVVPPIDTAVVLRELQIGCDARCGVRELERMLAVPR